MDLQLLADRQAIVDLTVAYCWALDTKRWDDLDDVFLADATALLASSTPLRSLDEIKQRVRGALEPLDDSQHLVGTHQVTVDGDEATCRCYLHAQHVRHAAAGESGGPNFVIGGRYEDRMVRTAAGWRIAHRELVTMWREGNPAVIVRS